jgi:hypothetical protein
MRWYDVFIVSAPWLTLFFAARDENAVPRCSFSRFVRARWRQARGQVDSWTTDDRINA